ncbi:hypothetical protein K2P97_13505 [bacterium]|nr:hypothetical protein [bacterium]BFD68034.1 hypothetical protein HAGR004_30560 [Bdellovibrio sp. HAGR004]
MPDFNLMGSLMRDLHQEFVRMYYLMLPVFFCLSIAVTWLRSPGSSIDFVDVLKRAMISTLLLAAFPEISQSIVFVADGIAEKIDSMNTLDAVIQMAKEKSESYPAGSASILLGFNDLLMAVLTFLSFLILFIARYLMIAMYHFFWVFYMVSAPLLLLFNLFPATGNITANLFRGMIEVACWKIVWAILGAMLASLAFGDAYKTEGAYVTIVVMNFVIAIAMLATPLFVKSLGSQGAQAMSSGIGQQAVAAMAAVPTKGMSLAAKGKAAYSGANGYAKNKIANYQAEKKRKRDMYRY